MKGHDLLDKDVDLPEIASLTKNFSGAEIAGIFYKIYQRFNQKCQFICFQSACQGILYLINQRLETQLALLQIMIISKYQEMIL